MSSCDSLSVSVFTMAGELYHEATYSETARIGDILLGADSITLRRQLLHEGQVLPDHALLADVLPAGARLQLLLQKRRLERVSNFPSSVANVAQRSLQIALAGQRGVGKTSLVSRYCRDEFLDTRRVMLSVIQVDFQLQRVVTDDGTCLKLLLWDEPIPPVHSPIPPHRFRRKHLSSAAGEHAAILVFDITNRRSFEDLQRWLSAARGANVQTMVLMGNKSDLDLNRQISHEEAQSFADAEGLPYFEVSMKEGSQGIEEAVTHVVFDVLAKLATESPPAPPGTPAFERMPEAESSPSCAVL
eukprot:s3659_g4.t1